MTLAQKICELREDRLRVMGLEQGFWANLKLVGVGFALKRAWQRNRLRRRGELALVIADYRRQVDDDIAAIEQDDRARASAGYRGATLSAEVARVIERFGREPDPHATADLRRFVKIHQQELAREIRKLELDERHPEPGVGRSVGRLRNWVADHRRIVLMGGSALLLGVLGWTIAYTVIQHRNRSRPTFTLAHVVESRHPGVLAAAWSNDSAMTANKIVNVFLSAELGNDASALGAMCDELGTKVEQSQRSVDAAQTHYVRGRPVGVRLAHQARTLFSGWSHSSQETGHTEEHCTTTTNADGEEEEDCTSTYVCDYVDHEWRLQPDVVRLAIRALEGIAPDVAPVDPGWADVLALEQRLRRYVEASPEYAQAEAKQRREMLARVDDWLGGLAVRGNDDLVERMRFFGDGFAAGQDLVWIHDHLDDESRFPRLATDRDYSCGGGSPPVGYVRCERVAREAEALDERQRELLAGLEKAAAAGRALESVVATLRRGLAEGRDADDFSREIDRMGEIAIRLQSALNPESNYRPLSKAWRVAIPLLVLVGLALCGTLLGWLLLRALERRRYFQRMVRRGIY